MIVFSEFIAEPARAIGRDLAPLVAAIAAAVSQLVAAAVAPFTLYAPPLAVSAAISITTARVSARLEPRPREMPATRAIAQTPRIARPAPVPCHWTTFLRRPAVTVTRADRRATAPANARFALFPSKPAFDLFRNGLIVCPVISSGVFRPAVEPPEKKGIRRELATVNSPLPFAAARSTVAVSTVHVQPSPRRLLHVATDEHGRREYLPFDLDCPVALCTLGREAPRIFLPFSSPFTCDDLVRAVSLLSRASLHLDDSRLHTLDRSTNPATHDRARATA